MPSAEVNRNHFQFTFNFPFSWHSRKERQGSQLIPKKCGFTVSLCIPSFSHISQRDHPQRAAARTDPCCTPGHLAGWSRTLWLLFPAQQCKSLAPAGEKTTNAQLNRKLWVRGTLSCWNYSTNVLLVIIKNGKSVEFSHTDQDLLLPQTPLCSLECWWLVKGCWNEWAWPCPVVHFWAPLLHNTSCAQGRRGHFVKVVKGSTNQGRWGQSPFQCQL